VVPVKPVEVVAEQAVPVVELKPTAEVQPAGYVVTIAVQDIPVVALNIAPAAQPATVEVVTVQEAPVVALYIAPAAQPATVDIEPPVEAVPPPSAAREIGPKKPAAGEILTAFCHAITAALV
jgi:hypothetical protein